MTKHEPFWLHLLRQRSVARWGNFSWFSAKTLLMSLNDQVAKEIESGQPGSIVDRRRMRWVAAQRDRGARCEIPLSLPETTGLLFLGDPGEMDASQYVLVRDLSLCAPHMKAMGIDTALLMSDVVYPAGDVNQWADAVYLPYFGLPPDAWGRAQEAYRVQAQPDADRCMLAPLRGWNVLAVPGNHDWYDGLNGFMFHVCGAEPLADVSYDEANLTRRQRLAKYSWRSPAAPERERVTKLRAIGSAMAPRPAQPSREALYLAGGDMGNARALQGAAVQPSELPSRSMPNLPGPYFAVDIGQHPSRCVDTVGRDGRPSRERAPVLRVVAVDTGITGTIDPEQAAWIEQMLAEPDLPKVVVTGIPMLVNNTVHPFPVSEPEDPLEPPPKKRRTLQMLLEKGDSVVATVAGDTHNYQRMIVHGGQDAERGDAPGDAEGRMKVQVGSRFPGQPDEDGRERYPSVQIVAGGAGAYMSRTHNVKYTGTDLELEGAGAPKVTVPTGRHTIFPSRAASVVGYADRVRAGYLKTLVVLSLVGLGALGWLIEQVGASYGKVAETEVQAFGLGEDATLRWFIAGTWVAAAGLAALLGGAVILFRRSKKTTHRQSLNEKTAWRWLMVFVALGLVTGLAFWQGWGLAETGLVVLGLVEVLLLATAHYLVPLLQSFPHLRRSLGFRALVLVVVVPVILRYREFAIAAVLAVLAAAAFLVVVRNFFRWRRHKAQKSLHGPSLTRLGVIPFVVVAFLTSWFTLVSPGHLVQWAYRLDEHTSAWGLAIRINSLATLTLVCLGVLVFALVVPLFSSRRHVPRPVWGMAVMTAVVGGGVAWWWGRDLGGSLFVLIPLAAVLALLLGILLGLAFTGRNPVSVHKIDTALVARDVNGERAREATLALAMTIAAIPSVDSLAEATDGEFHKNVLTMDTRVSGETTVITFRAYGLNNESGSPHASRAHHEVTRGGAAPDQAAYPRTGFFPIDTVEITYTPD